MKKLIPSSPPRPSADSIRRYVNALPALPEPLYLDDRAAQAARSVLELNDPLWGQRLGVQIDAIMKEVIKQLDYDTESGRFAITSIELRGIIAQAASRASGQFAVNIGQALEQTPVLAAQFVTQDDDDSNVVTTLKQAELPQE